MDRIRFGVLLLLTFSGCVSPALTLPDPPVRDGDVPVVFIHGILGGVLSDASGTVRYLTPGAALGLSTPDLHLPPVWDQGVQNKDGLHPSGALMRVGLIRYLIEKPVYAPWIEFASNVPNRPLYVFSYDWRRDNAESAALFEKFLEGIRSRHGKKVQIVAHSMGGLITLCVWNRRPDLIDRVVFAGVPFRGGAGYLDNMYLGTPVGANGSMLSAEVIFSHPSVYSFYPAGQDFENKVLAEDENGRALDLDFYDPLVWRKNGFGPFAPQNASWGGEARLSFLTQALKQARAFRLMLKPAKATYREALVITSKAHPTLARIRRVPQESSVPLWDFDAVARAPGDGSVRYEDAIPPEPIPSKVHLSDFGHSYLLNDPAAQAKIVEFLK